MSIEIPGKNLANGYFIVVDESRSEEWFGGGYPVVSIDHPITYPTVDKAAYALASILEEPGLMPLLRVYKLVAVTPEEIDPALDLAWAEIDKEG